MVGIRYEFNRPPVSPPSGNAAHMTVTNAARNRAGAYSEVSAIKHGVAPPRPKPRQHSEGDQHGNGSGERGQDGEDADQDCRDNQQCLAAEAIGQRPECGSAEGCPDQRRRENRLEIGDLDAELVGNERRRDADRLGIAPSNRLTSAQQTMTPIWNRVSGPSSISRVMLTSWFWCGASVMVGLTISPADRAPKAESPICRSRLSRSAARIARTSANASFLSRLTMT